MKRAAKLNTAEVTAIGIGGMIGGGIFAVMGLAIATAGSAVVPALLLGGVIAFLTGLSYARLGAFYGGDGGSFTYIREALDWPVLAEAAGWLLVMGYVGTLALYASAFGAYGASILGAGQGWEIVLAALVLGVFLGINLLGAKTSGSVELIVVAIKLAILALFAAAGLMSAAPARLVPSFENGATSVLAAAALIFVAYEGFELIPNVINEMKTPKRTLPVAILAAIVITAAIYVTVAMAALGNLTPAEIAKDQEYVLAVAARPALGGFGFTLIGIAALLSTSSAVNATLFGASRLAMVMAGKGALPRSLAALTGDRQVPRNALMALSGLALLFTAAADLTAISFLASSTFLLIFAAVNLAGLRTHRRIGLNPVMPLAGAILALASLAVLLVHAAHTHPMSLAWMGGFYGAAALVQIVFRSRG